MIDQMEIVESQLLPSTSEPVICVLDDDLGIHQRLSDLFQTVNLPVRAFTSAAEFLEREHHQGPCCIVVEPNLRGMDGLELQTVLAGSTDQFVFLSNLADVSVCARAMKAGAVDFLVKPAKLEKILEAANRGLVRSEAILTEKIARTKARAKFASLTPREFAVMHRVIAGRLNKQIAAELCIAVKTTKVHRGRVMRKTGVVSVADLVRLAITAGIPDSIVNREDYILA